MPSSIHAKASLTPFPGLKWVGPDRFVGQAVFSRHTSPGALRRISILGLPRRDSRARCVAGQQAQVVG